MKNNALRNILPLILAIFLSSLTFSAHAFKLESTFDLVQIDYPDLLEPTGEGKIVVEFADDLLQAYGKDPYSLQYIVDAAKPVLDKYAEEIGKEGKNVQRQIDEFKKLKADKTTPKASINHWADVLKEHNTKYKALVEKAKKEAEAAMQDQWVKLVGSRADLKKYSIKIGITVAEGIFEIAKGIVSAVASMGADPTAYLGIVQGIIKIYGAVSDSLKSEEAARKELESAMKSAKDEIGKLANADSTPEKLFRDWYSGKKGETLHQKMETFQPKLIKARMEAQELAKTLQTMLDNANPSKPMPAETIQAQINSVTKIGELVSSGEALLKTSKNLLDLLAEVKKAKNKVAAQTIISVMGTGASALQDYEKKVKDANTALSIGKKLLEAFAK